MRRDGGNAHLNQDRRAGGRHDAVVRGGGNAHAQHDAAQHGQHQRQQRGRAGDADDDVDQLGRKARDGQAARDDARDAAGHGHGDHAASARLQGSKDALGAEAAIRTEGRRNHAVGRLLARLLGAQVAQEVVDEAHRDGRQNGDGCGELHGLGVAAHQVDQDDQGQQQVAVLDELAHAGQQLLRDALQAQLLGLQVHRDEDAQEVQHRRQDRAHDDVGVGHAHVLRHQEGRSAHDGGHDLAAGGGGGLNRARELRSIAGLLHHRDGDGAGGDGVAHGGAGHHAAQRRGHDRDLRRAAREAAAEAVRQADEEVGDAGALQERAEDDEHDDVLGADVDRGGEHAAVAVEQLVDHQRNAALVPQGNQGVDHEHARHAQDRQTHAAAAQLGKHQHANRAGHDVEHVLGDAHVQLHHGLGVEGVEQERARAQHHQHDVIPGHVIDPHLALLGRVGQKTDEHHQSQEGGQADLLHEVCKQGHIDAEERKQHRHAVDDDLGHALPHARVRLSVELAHDLIDFRSRTNVRIRSAGG